MAGGEGAAEGEFIHELQIAAYGHSAGGAGDDDAERVEQTGQIQGSGFAFNVGAGGDYDFLDLPAAEPIQQLFDFELVGADAFNGVHRPVKHMVETFEFAAALHHRYVSGFLHHADDGCVSALVVAELADVVCAEIAASGAELDFLLCRLDGGGEPLGFFGRGLQDVESDALRRFSPDAWQTAELVNQLLHRRRVDVHRAGC